MGNVDIVYTDGSKNKEDCGCAILFISEATAILEALKNCYNNSPRTIVLMCDSVSVLDAIENRKFILNTSATMKWALFKKRNDFVIFTDTASGPTSKY